MSLGPFDLTGGPFLTLYCVLFVATVIAGFIIPAWLRPEGHERRVTDPDQLALLAGGRARFGDTVVARLLARGALVMAGKTKFQPQDRHAGRTPAERSVLAVSGMAGWGEIDRALRPHAGPVDRALTDAGLLFDGATAWQMRFWQTSPFFFLLGFGLIKWEVGAMRDRPVDFLIAFLTVTAICALIRFAALDRRTQGGIVALSDAREEAQRLRLAPASNEMDLAVALFGTAVLAGSPLAAYHSMRSSSSNSGDAGSSDGGGCGGGGCGG